MRRSCTAILALSMGCAASRVALPAPPLEEVYVWAVREEARALRHVEGLVAWELGSLGQRPLAAEALEGHEGLASRIALEALSRAEGAPGRSRTDRLSLRFLRRSLASRSVLQATAGFDALTSALSQSATAKMPFLAADVAFRDLGRLVASEPDGERRAQLHLAWLQIADLQLNPVLLEREAAAQKAARAAGYVDYVALAEDIREVDLHALLADGVAYLKSTETSYLRALSRVAHDELGLERSALRASDLPRLFRAPHLAGLFPDSGQKAALRQFLKGIGLDLHTSAGTEVRIDEEAHPARRARAFTAALDGPSDVRICLPPSTGLDGYGTLFHEAGHALHFAWSEGPREQTELGHLGPSEAFGELFRGAFADPAWVAKSFPALTRREVADVVRREALSEMLQLRRYAFAKIAFELRLHGRPASSIAEALAVLPDAAAANADLRELYRQLFSAATGVPLTRADAGRFLTDADDTFYAADYARAFALAAMMDESLRDRFGAWTSRADAGPWLRRELFADGRALSVYEVAIKLGFAPRLDFALAARRAERLLAEADALEARP